MYSICEQYNFCEEISNIIMISLLYPHLLSELPLIATGVDDTHINKHLCLLTNTLWCILNKSLHVYTFKKC